MKHLAYMLAFIASVAHAGDFGGGSSGTGTGDVTNAQLAASQAGQDAVINTKVAQTEKANAGDATAGTADKWVDSQLLRAELDALPTGGTVDTTITDGGTNPVDSNAIFDALALKTDGTALAAETAARTAADTAQDTVIAGKADTAALHDAVTIGAGSNAALALSGQELTLTLPTATIDTAITDGSTNAVENNAVFDGLDFKVDKAEKASAGDILAGTADKWVDATELDANLDALSGDYLGSVATIGAAPSLKNGRAIVDNDLIYLSAVDGGNQIGFYARSGAAWVYIPIGSTQIVRAATTTELNTNFPAASTVAELAIVADAVYFKQEIVPTVFAWTNIADGGGGGGSTTLGGLSDVDETNKAVGRILEVALDGVNHVYVDKPSGGGGTGVVETITINTANGITNVTTGTLADPIYSFDINAALMRTALQVDNVDNTSDANKPVSTATQTALDLKADATAVAANTTALSGIASGAEVNVQADWNEASAASDAFIQNKPTITGSNTGDQDLADTIPEVTGLQTALDAKVDDGQVLTDVPAGAVFTDNQDISGIATNATAIAANVTAIGLNTAKTTNATHTGDVTGDTALTITTGSVAGDELASTTVTAGVYTNANITVDADGRVTAAANGAGGGSAHGDGANCPAGQYPLGVDESGVVQGCTVDADTVYDDTPVADNASNIATNVTAIGLNTAKVTNATHTGDVTGATALTIANDAVTDAKAANNLTIAGSSVSPSVFQLPQGVGSSQDGVAFWDTASNTLKIGNGGLTTEEFFPGAHTVNTNAQTICTGAQLLQGDGTCIATPAAGTGDVVGPAGSIDGNIASFLGPSGEVIQDSGVSASAVTANTAKVGYTEALVSANTDVAANTAKVTYDDAAVVAANTAATALNTLKISYTDAALVASHTTAIGLNTAKVTYPSADSTKLAGIEIGATADQTNIEIEAAYNAQVGIVSQADAEAGTSTTAERWTPERVAQAIAALGAGGTNYEHWSFPLGAAGDDVAIGMGMVAFSPVAGTNARIQLACETPPVGSSMVVDVLVGGASIGVLTLPAGQATPVTTQTALPIAADAFMKPNVTAVGATTAGADCSVNIRAEV